MHIPRGLIGLTAAAALLCAGDSPRRSELKTIYGSVVSEKCNGVYNYIELPSTPEYPRGERYYLDKPANSDELSYRITETLIKGGANRTFIYQLTPECQNGIDTGKPEFIPGNPPRKGEVSA